MSRHHEVKKSSSFQVTENNTGSHRDRSEIAMYTLRARGAWRMDGAVQRSKHGKNNCKGTLKSKVHTDWVSLQGFSSESISSKALQDSRATGSIWVMSLFTVHHSHVIPSLWWFKPDTYALMCGLAEGASISSIMGKAWGHMVPSGMSGAVVSRHTSPLTLILMKIK